jgi:hypothetical protein
MPGEGTAHLPGQGMRRKDCSQQALKALSASVQEKGVVPQTAPSLGMRRTAQELMMPATNRSSQVAKRKFASQ